MIDLVGVGVVVLAVALLGLRAAFRRTGAPRLRSIIGLTRLHRAFGNSVEDGTRLLLAVGGDSLLTRNAGSALAGLRMLRSISGRATGSDRPPIAVAGEAPLALLTQDTLHAGYGSIGAPEYFRPAAGRLAGLTPFSAAAGTMPMISDEQTSAAALIGHFGVESALLSEAAERSGVFLIGATDDPAAQSVLFASSSEALIGEELFAAPAYLTDDPGSAWGLMVQDILRWLVIVSLLAGSALKLFGIL